MYQKYLAEGEKIILELLEFKPSLVDQLYATPDFIETHTDIIRQAGIGVITVNAHDLERISNLNSPQKVCAVVRMPDENFEIPKSLPFKKVLYLDEVRDPGNLGTIIRSADWFGWDLILLSPECVDPYNPKVVQSAMGSLFRVKIRESELKTFLEEATTNYTTYAAEMNGSSIYEVIPEYPMILIMGNESHGVRVNALDQPIHHVSIPRYNRQTESLNVGIACSIIMAEWNRRIQDASI